MVVSYRLSIVTVALSVTIRLQFAIECLRRSNQQGLGHFGPKFRSVTLGSDPSCWGYKERTSQANQLCNYFRGIPTCMITIHQRHRRTEGRTDRQTTCDRNTALCTKVHRAVKTDRQCSIDHLRFPVSRSFHCNILIQGNSKRDKYDINII